jgi:hypothetical protein
MKPRLLRISSVLATGALLATALQPAASAATQPARAAPRSARAGSAARPFVPISAPAHRRGGTHRRYAPGENPPGRVTQVPGQAGYEAPVPEPAPASVQTTVTVPAITCHTGSNPGFGDVNTSNPAPSVLIGFNGTLEVLSELIYNCSNGVWAGLSTIDPSCSHLFGGFCFYEPFAGGTVHTGDQVQLTASLSPAASSTTITDLTSGAHLSFTNSGSSASSAVAVISAYDLCFLPGGNSEACSVDDGSSTVPPPGYAGYTPITFGTSEINGTGLGSYLAGPDSTGWLELNNVWGPTLEGQTTYVGSTDTFTDTNAQLTLPTVSLSNPTIDQPATGPASVQFTATLSASSSYPIYVDYATQDQSAFAGTNYTAVNGTLTFPPGTTTGSVSVPIIPGPETGNGSNGNKLTFLLNLSNPSYVYGGGSGQATIYEGPVVNSVSPANVPLNGGPSMAVTLTGVDLSRVTSAAFCPVASGGGGPCVQAIGVSGQSETSVTVTAPDASGSVGANQTSLTTDAVVTNASNISSPVNSPGDYLVFGCKQQAVTDGTWQASGCLTDEPNGVDVAQTSSAIDGVNVTPPAKTIDAVSYQTSSAQVTSSRSVTVSLPMLGNPAVQIFKGALTKALSGPVSFTVPKNTMLGGLTISGTVTITPTPGMLGQASGKVSVTLPPILGGGKGTLAFTTATGGTLTNLTVSVPKANFLQLFALSKLKLSYSASGSTGTWSVSGTASTGGQTSTKFSGSLVYSNNALKSASLKVSAISLAGLLDISNLTASYNGTSWSGSATVAQGKQTGTVALTFTGSTLTAAEIKTGPVALFGIININSFDLTYGGGNWSLAVTSTLPGGGTASATLAVANGIINSASLTLTNFALAKAVTIASATVSYAASQPNSQCNTVTGTEIWCGSWDISFPGTQGAVSGVSGSLAFQNGSFASGSVTVNGSVPLIDGVFLTQLGGTLTVNPAPATVSGTATITFGPQISGVSALSATGTLTRTFPAAGTGGSYDASATVTALPGSTHSLVLGTVKVTVPDSGPTTADLTLGGGPQGLSITVGKATATIVGEVKGTFTSSTFSLTGTTMITVPVLGTLSGTLKADNTGVASCAKTSGGTQVGFEYYWTTGAIDVFDSKGCSERGF